MNKHTYRQRVKIIRISLLINLCIVIINFHFLKPQELQNEDDLSQSISTVKGIIQLATVHRLQIEKICSIINEYNPDMENQLKVMIAKEIQQMSIKYDNLDIELICATITHESARTWDPCVISPVGAMGLMQIMPATGKYLAVEDEIPWTSAKEVLLDPINNIRMGCRYLSLLISAYHLDGGLAAYNGGMKHAERWVQNGRAKDILPQETAFYVPSVLKIYEELKLIR